MKKLIVITMLLFTSFAQAQVSNQQLVMAGYITGYSAALRKLGLICVPKGADTVVVAELVKAYIADKGRVETPEEAVHNGLLLFFPCKKE